MPEKSSVILFDLWMTLIYSLPRDPILDLQQILGYKCGQAGADINMRDISKLDKRFARACLTSDISDEAAFLAHLSARFGIVLTAEMHEQFAQLLAAERAGATLYPETLEVLTELKRRGKRLGLVSNLWPFPVPHIFHQSPSGLGFGLGSFFEHCFYSFAEGEAKPHRRMFQSPMRCFGVAADQCLMVGDSLVSDIRGASSVGMPAVLINRSGQSITCPPGTRQISSLLQLLEDC